MISENGLPTCSELNLVENSSFGNGIWTTSGDGASNITVLMGKSTQDFILINGNDYPISYQCCFGGVCSMQTSINGIIGANSVKLLKTVSSINAWQKNSNISNQVFSTKIDYRSAGDILGTLAWFDADYRGQICPAIIDSSYTFYTWKSLLSDSKFPILRMNGFKISKLNFISSILLNKELTANGIVINSFVPLFIGWVQNGSDGAFCIAGLESSGGTTYWKSKD